MDPTALYYALSTIAQCAAALAALIGFLGWWRLDRLEDEDTQLERTLRGFLIQITSEASARLTRAMVLDRCRRIVAEPQPGAEEQFKPQIAPRLARLNALPGEQQRLLWVLYVFLIVTLMILGAAVIGFLYVGQVKDWAWTPWLLWIAGGLLAGGPIGVVFIAARLPCALYAFILLLSANNIALAETVSEEAILYQVQGGPYSQDNGPMFNTFEACERSLAYQQALVKLADIQLSKDELVFARCFRIYFCVKNGEFTSPCRATMK